MIKEHWNEEIPVIMISSENSPDTMRRAYEMGVVDYISRPFDARVVYRRVLNTIKFYAKQRHLVTLITNQVYEKEKNNRMMISILSQIVEFRNGESGQHVLNINILTGLLLESLVQKTDKYHFASKVDTLKKAVIELDGRPAADVYSNEVGVPKNKIVENVFNNPMGRAVGEEVYISSMMDMMQAASVEQPEQAENEGEEEENEHIDV